MAKPAANNELRQALAACRGGFFAVAVFSLFINLLMLATPIYMLQLFDRVLGSRSTDTLMVLTIIAVVALLTMAGLMVVRGRVMVWIGTWIDRRLSGSVLAATIEGGLKGREPSVQGLRDVGTVRSFLTRAGILPIMDAPWTPVFILIVFLLHPLLGWIAVAGAVVLFGLALFNELATRKILARSNASHMDALRQAESAVHNADAINAMGMAPNLIRRWQARNAETTDLQARASNRSGAINSASKFFRLILQIAMLGTGAWLVLQNEITPGVMIAGSILMARALAPVEQAIGTWRSAVAARDSFKRIKQVLATQPEREAAMPLPVPSGALSVEGLAYVHPGASDTVLRGISFELAAGEAMGLIGPSASGKTTLARLLVGNLAPRAGHARLDGMDMAQWDAEDRGQYIGYLPQDVELFRGTVRENIARMGEGDSEAIFEAARLAGVHDLIMRLEKGYETEIGEGGAALSGGERQRIALARALYGNAKFIVLDEPNASVDSEGEAALVAALGALHEKGVTMVVIAHRPSILRNMDKVLVLQDGAMRAFGPRDEILPAVAARSGDEAAPRAS
jgi:PrtD family type I secretion system ABC transporter